MGSLRNRTRQSGFTFIEVLVVVIIMGVLTTLVLPGIRLTATRAKLSEVMVMFGSCRTAISEIYLYEDNLPDEGEWGCESTPGTSVSKYVDAVQTGKAGTIKVTIHGTNDLRLDWHTITLAPLNPSGSLMSEQGRIYRWRCGSTTDGTDVALKYLPVNCSGT